MRTLATLTCEYCGSEFRVRKYLSVGPNARRYCSQQCYARGRDQHGPLHARWRGEVRFRTDGRKLIYTPDRENSSSGRFTMEYVLVAERALGKRLPKKAVVHHVDEDPGNNAPGNLVICQDQSYHKLLHVRTRTVRAGGNPNTEKLCNWCKQLKSLSEFYQVKARHAFSTTAYPYCRDCCAAKKVIAKERRVRLGTVAEQTKKEMCL